MIMNSETSKMAGRILILNTIAFTVCFAAWMINGVLATYLVEQDVFHWTPVEIGWLMGMPVLIGSVLRLPVGILTDKIGGKWMLTFIMVFCAIPMYFLSVANNYTTFLLLSFGFGLSGASFAAGVAYTSLWFSKEKQGTALGIFGMGTIGAALTTFFAPTLLKVLTDNGNNIEGWRNLPKLYAALLLVTALFFFLATKHKRPLKSANLKQRLAPLKEIRVWRFGFYYFFAFGGFVALSQWLIPYYVNVYSMTIVSAGIMAAAFSLPSGIFRAAGGMLSDKVGARMVLLWVLGISLVCMFFLFIPRMEIQAPGQGIMAAKSGKVIAVSDHEIVIGVDTYVLQSRAGGSSSVTIRFGIHHDQEGFLFLPTTTFHQVPNVKVGDEVVKGELLAKGLTSIYFQANKWIFSSLVFIIGIMMGLGGAAVYKHISDYYPENIGTVGGIVGVLGGLGGFFGPITFGYLLKVTGIWTSCWMFLSVLVAICIVLQRTAINAISKKKV